MLVTSTARQSSDFNLSNTDAIWLVLHLSCHFVGFVPDTFHYFYLNDVTGVRVFLYELAWFDFTLNIFGGVKQTKQKNT